MARQKPFSQSIWTVPICYNDNFPLFFSSPTFGNFSRKPLFWQRKFPIPIRTVKVYMEERKTLNKKEEKEKRKFRRFSALTVKRTHLEAVWGFLGGVVCALAAPVALHPTFFPSFIARVVLRPMVGMIVAHINCVSDERVTQSPFAR